MQITLYGAAGEVTGSAYLVETERARLLVDFGMFQGSRDAERRNQVPRRLAPRKLDAVVLTHAHLDHIGRLPLLTRAGYRGPIYATAGTLDVAGLLLEDAARIQEDDAERLNRKRQRAGLPPAAPLFTHQDIERVVAHFSPLPYNRRVEVAPGVAVIMVEAGHTLGSASVVMQLEQHGRTRTVVFSGDIGPRGAPFLKDPAEIGFADLVFLESTYGDRDHRSLEATVAEFTDLVREAVRRRSKILVPTFAVGRTQELLYILAGLFREQQVRPFPIFLDSPLAIRATQLYLKHPELADEEASLLGRKGSPLGALPTLQMCETVEQSRALNKIDGPALIMAGSGMCNAGRILHHLKNNLWREETMVIIVGYQGQGTLGRQLIERAKRVRIFGEPIAVRASIHSLGGFSAHAGQSELLRWFAPMADDHPRIVLTHGEDRAREPLARLIAERFSLEAELPGFEAVIRLD